MSENLKEAVAKLTAVLDNVDAANEMLAKVKDDVKDMGLNARAIIYGIKRAKKKKEGSETIELQDDMYDIIFQEELV